MLKVKFYEIKDQLTDKQIEAIEKCQRAYFYAEMSDDYSCTVKEKECALKTLKTYFKNLVDYIDSWTDDNDTLIFNGEVA